jgi:hypothetical protein
MKITVYILYEDNIYIIRTITVYILYEDSKVYMKIAKYI